MKKLYSTLLLSAIVILFTAFTFNTQNPELAYKYVGVKKCGMCHKSDKQGKQLSIWEKSDHAKAYETLKTAKADEIAKKKGLKTKAVDAPECLKCHATGYDKSNMLEATFKIEQGIQCESCHGAGSEYSKVKKPSMSREDNKKAAVAKGLDVHADTEKFCKTCHNPESPTYKPFNFKEKWNLIKHYVPKS